MRAESFSPEMERGGSQVWLPLLHGVAAALLIGLVGSFATLQVWVLALTGALISHSIARRDGSEPEVADRTATLLKLAFLAVLCAAAFDNRERSVDVLHPSPGQLCGFAVLGAGLFLRQRAMAALGTDFTIKVVVRDDHRLIEHGPYRVVRHPNYTGLLLVMLATVALLQSPLGFAAVLLLWLPALVLRIRAEEAALATQLGDEYRSYAQRTWRLVPGFY